MTVGDRTNSRSIGFSWPTFEVKSTSRSRAIGPNLREAQTMTMSKLANTGEAVITDLGEAADIHPRNKQDVAKRLARWALAKEYGYEIPFRSPTYQSVEFRTAKPIVEFDHVGSGLDTFDVNEPIGFAIAGEDKNFVKASASIVDKDTIEVWSDEVTSPVAVRYAWADNPDLQCAKRRWTADDTVPNRPMARSHRRRREVAAARRSLSAREPLRGSRKTREGCACPSWKGDRRESLGKFRQRPPCIRMKLSSSATHRIAD